MLLQTPSSTGRDEYQNSTDLKEQTEEKKID